MQKKRPLHQHHQAAGHQTTLPPRHQMLRHYSCRVPGDRRALAGTLHKFQARLCHYCPASETCVTLKDLGYPSQQDCAFQGCRRLQQTEWPQRLHARIPGALGEIKSLIGKTRSFLDTNLPQRSAALWYHLPNPIGPCHCHRTCNQRGMDSPSWMS